jgi:hypothetical protein
MVVFQAQALVLAKLWLQFIELQLQLQVANFGLKWEEWGQEQ